MSEFGDCPVARFGSLRRPLTWTKLQMNSSLCKVERASERSTRTTSCLVTTHLCQPESQASFFARPRVHSKARQKTGVSQYATHDHCQVSELIYWNMHLVLEASPFTELEPPKKQIRFNSNLVYRVLFSRSSNLVLRLSILVHPRQNEISNSKAHGSIYQLLALSDLSWCYRSTSSQGRVRDGRLLHVRWFDHFVLDIVVSCYIASAPPNFRSRAVHWLAATQ